jgi:acetyltransferase-like isoleucine patch superfamily enzyme
MTALHLKVIKLFATRPLSILEHVRGKFLFHLVLLLRRIQEIPGAEFEDSVRLQRYRSIQAELPYASIKIGRNTIIYESNRINAYGHGKITIGQNSILGETKIFCRNSIQIGARCLFSWGVFIQDFDSHAVPTGMRQSEVLTMVRDFYPNFGCVLSETEKDILAPFPKKNEFPTNPVLIGDDVWVGANVTILKGVTLENGCIVGAGAVVKKGIYPAGSILAGNPAQVVRNVNDNLVPKTNEPEDT